MTFGPILSIELAGMNASGWYVVWVHGVRLSPFRRHGRARNSLEPSGSKMDAPVDRPQENNHDIRA